MKPTTAATPAMENFGAAAASGSPRAGGGVGTAPVVRVAAGARPLTTRGRARADDRYARGLSR